MDTALSLANRQIWTAFLAVDGIGRGTFWKVYQWLRQYQIPWSEFWFGQDTRAWVAAGLLDHQMQALYAFQKQWSPETYYGWLQKQGIEVITFVDDIYPKLLMEFDKKPIILYTKGAQLRWNELPIGVVGTRHSSGYGRSATEHLVAQLVAEGAGIISGFMYGIDATAHEQAIQSNGYTVAVLGYGFNHVYPREQRPLLDQLLAVGGSVITEYAPHVRPNQGTFPERNRIIAGMSEAVVVIEAGIESGSHITAKWALELGRPVCAVPGPITNPFSEGTKWLINQGAALVSSGQDVITELPKYAAHPEASARIMVVKDEKKIVNSEKKVVPADPACRRFYEELRAGGATTDELVERLHVPLGEAQITLSHLEIDGHIRREGAVWLVT